MGFRLRGLGRTVTAAFLVGLFGGTPALADWKRAESPRFIVYYEGSEAALRRYVRDLEIYDFVLRRRIGLPLDAEPGRKFPIYLVGSRTGLLQVHPESGDDVAGTYFPTGEDIFAVAIHEREQDTLLHEYFHHFSMEMNSVAHYPGWLIEGLAEYFMTAEIEDDQVVLGHRNANRVSWLLNASWIDLPDLLSKRPGEIRRAEDRATYYPVAWLLTHWFLGDPARNAQLRAYVDAVQKGGDPVTSMEAATGMTLGQVRQALRRHLRAGGQIPGVRGNLPNPPVTITRLPASADDLLLIGQRLKVGVPAADRAATAALVRRLAARHPDDVFAQLQLGHAELHFGDREAGAQILAKVLEREPANVEALQLLASHHIHLANQSDDGALQQIAQARQLLRRAFETDPSDYRTLRMLAETRQGASGYPTDNDLATWALAHEAAPQISAVTLGYARALMLKNDFDAAVGILEPLANAPHGGPAAVAGARLLERAKAGESPITVLELEAIEEADDEAGRQPQPDDPSEPEPSGTNPGA